MNAYVINLKERTDRWSHIQNKLSNFHLKLQRFDAIRSNVNSGVSVSPFVKSCLTYKDNCSKYHIESLGALGCAMSHIEIWKNITETSFVFEDDADPMEFAKQDLDKAIQLMQNNTYDFIFLGSHNLPIVKGTTLIPWNKGGKIMTGAWAYILTPSAAKKLIENVYPLDLQIDIFIQSIPLQFGYIPCFKQRFFLQPPNIQHLEEKLYSKNELYKYLIFSNVIISILTIMILRYFIKTK